MSDSINFFNVIVSIAAGFIAGASYILTGEAMPQATMYMIIFTMLGAMTLSTFITFVTDTLAKRPLRAR